MHKYLPIWVNIISLEQNSTTLKTKDKILESARVLFMKYGQEGVKMQMIADNAGVNKGLLHYYFKNKETIFKAIYKLLMHQLLESIETILKDNNKPFEQKTQEIVSSYFKLLKSNKKLPVFIISEMNKDQEVLTSLNIVSKIKSTIGNSSQSYTLETLPNFTLHFFITLVSLCAFPFMAFPLISEVLDSNKKAEDFLKEREEYVTKIMLQLLENKN